MPRILPDHPPSLVSSRTSLALLVLLPLAACAGRDPYERDDVWKPTGSNMGNIAAMVANPHDLIEGRHANRGDTKASTVAIQHVWEGQVQPLGGSSSSGSSSSGQSGGSGGSGGGSSSAGGS